MKTRFIRVAFLLALTLALGLCLTFFTSCVRTNSGIPGLVLQPNEVLSDGYVFRSVINEYGEGYELTSFRYYGEEDRGGVITVPSHVNGEPVIGISSADETSVNTVILPSTLRYIHNSFRHCYDLTSLVIPDSVVSISGSFMPGSGAYAVWRGCPKLVQVENGFAYVGDWLVYNVDVNEDEEVEPTIREGTVGIATGVKLFELIDEDGKLVIPEGVKRIGRLSWFNNNTYMSDCVKDLVLPESLEIIGEEAFGSAIDCKNKIVLPNVKHVGKEAFYGAVLGELILSGPIEYIGDGAFKDLICDRFYIGENVRTWGENIFQYCEVGELAVPACLLGSVLVDSRGIASDRIGAVRITSGKITYAMWAPSLKKLVIGEGVTAIAANAFENCTSLETLVVENKNVTVDATAFLGCHNLKDVTATAEFLALLDLGSLERVHVTGGTVRAVDLSYVSALKEIVLDPGASVESGVLSGIETLISATVPMSMLSELPGTVRTLSITDGTALSAADVARFTALESITLPKTLTAIGADAFLGMTALESVCYEGTVATWAAIRFENAAANPLMYAKALVMEGEVVTSAAGLTTLTPYAFAGYKALTSVDLSGLTVIPTSAFEGCMGLTRVVIPAAIREIGESAFFGCTALAEATFEQTTGWVRYESATASSGSEIYAYYLEDGENSAILLIDTYAAYIWRRMI